MKRSEARIPVRLKRLLVLAVVLGGIAVVVNVTARNEAASPAAVPPSGSASPNFLPEWAEIRQLDNALRERPENAGLRMRLAQLLFMAGEYSRALVELRILEAGQPRNSELRLRKSMVLSRLGRPEDAAREARLAVRYRPEHLQAITWLGDLYLELGRSQDALETYEKALKRDPSSYDALMGKGRAREQLYIAKHPVSPQQIVEPIARAVELEPDNARGLIALARMTFNYLMESDRAEDLALKAAALDPTDAESWLILAEISLNRPASEENLLQAGQRALGAAERAPQDWRPPYQFGRVLLKQNEPAEAVRFFRKSIELEQTPSAIYQLSQAARRSGQLDLAREYGATYSRWNVFMEKRKMLLGDIQRSPDNPENYFKLAELYAETDAPDPAENWLNKAMLIRKDAPRAAAITRQIQQLRQGHSHGQASLQPTPSPD